MKITKVSGLVLSLAIGLIAINSCEREKMATGSASGKIKTKVAAQGTKASDNTSAELAQTIVMSEEDSLILQEFVSDNLTQPFRTEDIQTKGTVVTTENIGTVYGGDGFGMEGFVDYNSIDCDEINWPKVYVGGEYQKLTDDHYIIGGVSTFSDNVWTLKDGGKQEYPWLNDIDFTFWSYAPKTLSFTIAESRTTMTISDYMNPLAAADQKDILIAYNTQKYAGTTASQTVNIEFRHALADVFFDVTAIKEEDITVKDISIINAYKTASCTTYGGSGDGKLYDTNVENSFHWIDYKAKGTFTMSGADDHFLMIPQALPNDAKISITLVKDGTEIISEAALKTTWLVGKKYEYVLKYDGSDIYVFSVEENTGMDMANISFAGDDGNFNVVSYKKVRAASGYNDVPVAWTAEYSTDGGTTWSTTKPAMLKSISAGSSSGSVTGEDVGFEVDMQHFTFEPRTLDTRVVDMRATTIGSADNYVDVRTLDNNGKSQATANCYIVGHPGYYKLPLVYGNALRADGSTHIQRVNKYDGWSGVPLDDYYQDAVDHNDQVINKAYIYEKYTCNDCVLIWQDEPKVVKNVHISSDKHFLMFEVDYEHIMQSNAIVAVRDAEGTIMWSWHIWITDQILADTSYEIAGAVYPAGRDPQNFEYTMLRNPIGWCDGKTTYYGESDRNFKIRFVQSETNDQEGYTLNQLHSEYTYDDNCVFFQCCRINPEPPAVGFDHNESKKIYVDDEAYQFKSTRTKRVTRGEAIRNPNIHYGIVEGDESLQWCDIGWNAGWGDSVDDLPFARTPKTIYDPSPVGYMVPDPNIFRYYGKQADGGQWEKNKVLLKTKSGDYKIIWPTGQRDPEDGTKVTYGGEEGRIWCSGAYYGFLAFNGFFNNGSGAADKGWGNGWNCPAQGLYLLPIKE